MNNSDNVEEHKRYESVDEMIYDLESNMTFWDKVKRATWWKLINILDRLWYKIKKVYQKITKGRADEEIWDLSSHIIDYVAPRIKEFQKLDKMGYPCNGDEIKSQKEWDDILDKIAEAFDLAYRDEHTEDNLYYDYDTGEFNKERYLEHNKKLEEGFRLFGKYILALWD